MAANDEKRSKPLLRKWMPRAALAVALSLIAPALVLARAGGGEGYSGGGGGGGGGDGASGLIYLVFMLIRLCIFHPVIGLPILLLVIVFFVYAGQQGTNTYQSSVIRRGSDAIDQQSKSTAIDAIRRHDPQFDQDAFRQRVTTAFNKVQAAWVAQDLHPVRPFISDGVYERFSLQFAEQRDAGYRDQLDHLAIQSVTVADISSAGLFDEISVRIAASAADYRVSLTNGQRLSGTTSVEPFVEIWSFLRKRGAVTDLSRSGLIEGNCPNCGAPIEMNESANCANCKAVLRSGQYDWVLAEITQESEWVRSSARPIPGLPALREQDPGFDPLSLEDRASVVFWRGAAADRTGKVDPLRKVASEEFCAAYARAMQPVSGRRTFMGECAVGGVHMVGFIPARSESDPFERALVDVRWSGKKFTVGPDGQDKQLAGSVLARTLFIFGRKPGSQTDANAAISSAHCPNCGAPLSDQMSNACEYCNTVLNDGAHGWILLDMPGYSTPTAQEALSLLRETPAADLSSIPLAPAIPHTSDAGLVAWAVDVAAADGNVDDRERALLTSFASKRGIDSDRLDHMIDAALHGQIETPAPADRDEAIRWLSAMAAIAQADGNFSRQEYALLRALGDKVGLSDYDVQALIKQTRATQYQAASAALRGARRNGSDKPTS